MAKDQPDLEKDAGLLGYYKPSLSNEDLDSF